MSLSSEIPRKCLECGKFSKSIIHNKCHFCQDLQLQEEGLCHLNRCIQDPGAFECSAFQPTLHLVGPSAQDASTLWNGPKGDTSQRCFERHLNSDKIKYQWALAAQQLGRDPDAVIVGLEYHFAWNVIHRRPVFGSPAKVLDFVSDTFSDCSELVGGSVSLLWLAPDHVHFYVQSDGEKAIETIAQEMKRSSATAILAEFADLKAGLSEKNELWDAAYFVETI